MILGFHVIFGAYGFWLPNDPRGSWSHFVWSWELARFGEATTVTTRRSLAAAPHDIHAREAAKRSLKYPPVVLTGVQARSVGIGFATACREGPYAAHACSILPEHVHLVIGRTDRDIGRVIGHLKSKAKRQLIADGLWADARPVWANGAWKVFLDTPADVQRAIEYVEGNPIREGKRRQQWSFVQAYHRERAVERRG